MSKIARLRRIRDLWEALPPFAFAAIFVTGIFSPTFGWWPLAASITLFVVTNIGFFWSDWRLHAAERAALQRNGEAG